MQLSWLPYLAPLVSAELLPRGNSSSSTWSLSSTSSSYSSTTTKASTTTSQPSTITSSASLTSRTAAGETCGTCTYSPGDHMEWAFPSALIENITVATVIYRVNTIDNYTQTITSLATVTATKSNDADAWNSILNISTVSMKDGTPVFTKVFTVFTEADAYYTTAVSLQSPTSYENWGYLVNKADSYSQPFTQTVSKTIASSRTGCIVGELTIIAMTPTAPLPGQTALYEGFVKLKDWQAMVPSSIKEYCTYDMVAPAQAVSLQSALTATSTEYDDNVHAQSTTTKASAAAESTKESTKASAKESTKEATATKDTKTSTVKGSTKEPSTAPASTKESSVAPASTKESSVAPASTKESSVTPASTKATSVAPASSESASAASQQSQASQSVPSQAAASPASTPSPTTATITHVSTIASTGTSTVTPVIIASSTLLPGSTAIISSTTYSLQVTTSGSSTVTNLIANGQTLSSTSTAGYGSLIYSGLGGTVTASAGSATVETGTSVLGTSTSVEIAMFTGGARREGAVMGLVGIVGVIAVLI